MINFIEADVVKYFREYQGERFHASLFDAPYALIEMTKRFGKPGSAPAQEGADGAYSRLSTGFMGEEWDGFESLLEYEEWVSSWAEPMIQNVLLPGAIIIATGGESTAHRLATGLENGGFEIIFQGVWLHGQGFPKRGAISQKEPLNEYASRLKPSIEPIIFARSPRPAGTSFEACAETYSTGSFWIDGNRVGSDEIMINRFKSGAKPWGKAEGEEFETVKVNGRYPTNVWVTHDERCIEIFDGESSIWACVPDCPVRIMRDQKAEMPSFYYNSKVHRNEKESGLIGHFPCLVCGSYDSQEHLLPDGRKESCRRNPHPTVKPFELCYQLARLILPPKWPAEASLPLYKERRIIVPFSGVGSECAGASSAGWTVVEGIDNKLEYIEIARARVRGLCGLFV